MPSDVAESAAPEAVEVITPFTGAYSTRNIAMYERAGFHRSDGAAPPGAVGLVKSRR